MSDVAMTDVPMSTTAGYYQAHGSARVLRWTLGTVERVSPALAARLALRVFSTPLPLKWLNRPRALGHEWVRSAWPFEGASLGVYMRAGDEAGRPVALLVHGWGGHAGQMLPLAGALAAAGLQPVLLEMPAHGHSAGSTSNLPQFARAIEYVAARLAHEGHRLHTVAGHSLGANAAAYAASRGLGVQRLVLLAPPASPHEYTRLFAAVFGLTERTRSTLQRTIEAREAILMPQFEPHAVGPRIRVPVLVVHDRDDRINPLRDGEAFASTIAGAKLVTTEGLGHRRVVKDSGVLERVVNFVR